MILLLGGTAETRNTALALINSGFKVLVSVATDYGRRVLTVGDEIEIMAKPSNLSDLLELIRSRDIKAVVDCTHPFAVQASRNAIKACDLAGIGYVRLERDVLDLSSYREIVKVPDFEAAAHLVCTLQGTVMLTIGVKHIPLFIEKRRGTSPRLVARILPHPDSVARCLDMGLDPDDIVAIKGPFSVDFNRALFAEYGVTAVVTKESGSVGGTQAKLEAAKQLGIKSILIQRPHLEYPAVAHTVQDVIRHLLKNAAV